MRTYITTPIYYVNAVPHVGTATTTLLADAQARYHRMQGRDTWFLTGTDEHAQKVSDAAIAAGETPQAFVDKVSQSFVEAWKFLDCRYDNFIRTSEDRHKDVVREVFTRLEKSGDIYLGVYEGWYSVADETFFRDTDVDDNGIVKETGAKVERIREDVHYFRHVYLTGVGSSRLLENRNGHFVDVTQNLNAGVDGFTTAAVFMDANRDGRLDIFVARYVEWDPKTDLPCGPAGKPQYCAPYQYKAAHPELLLQQANGRFRKADKTWGIAENPGKTLAIAPYDFDKDGRLDLFLANDTEPDVLLVAGKDGHFKDMGIDAGVAVGINGSPTGSMGVDMKGDAKSDHLAVGVFAGQQLSLFDAPSANGLQLFTNVQQATGVASATLLATTFGLVISDINLDGRPDIVLANGHIDDDGMAVGSGMITYRQPLQVLSQRDDQTYASWTPPDGAIKSIVGRGLASGDFNNDGKSDLLVFENNGPVRLLRNDAVHQGPWLGIVLKGSGGKSDAQGAMVTVNAGSWSVRSCVTPVRSYLSICDPRVLVSLPKGTGSVNVDVSWPDGKRTSHAIKTLDRYVTVVKP